MVTLNDKTSFCLKFAIKCYDDALNKEYTKIIIDDSLCDILRITLHTYSQGNSHKYTYVFDTNVFPFHPGWLLGVEYDVEEIRDKNPKLNLKNVVK